MDNFLSTLIITIIMFLMLFKAQNTVEVLLKASLHNSKMYYQDDAMKVMNVRLKIRRNSLFSKDVLDNKEYKFILHVLCL